MTQKKKICELGSERLTPVKHQLLDLFWTLGPSFTRWAESHMEERGLTPQRMRILALLFEYDSMMMSSLRDELGVSATNITALVDALEEDGMVVRRPHATDRRATLIELTPKARKQLTGGCTEFKDRVSELFSVFSNSEQEQLLKLLVRMREALVERNILEPTENKSAPKAAVS